MRAVRQLADPTRDGTLFMRDLTIPTDAPSSTGAVVRAGRPGDARALEEAMHASGEYPDGVVKARLRDGRDPYIVEADGLIVSYGWVALSPEPIGDLGLSFRIDPDEAYIYDCATRPDYRGRGYYPLLLRYVVAELDRAGRRRAWIGTAPGNFTSQRGILRAGFVKVADINFSQRPDGTFQIDLYGTPGVPEEALEHAAWSFHGRAHPDAGIPT